MRPGQRAQTDVTWLEWTHNSTTPSGSDAANGGLQSCFYTAVPRTKYARIREQSGQHRAHRADSENRVGRGFIHELSSFPSGLPKHGLARIGGRLKPNPSANKSQPWNSQGVGGKAQIGFERRG